LRKRESGDQLGSEQKELWIKLRKVYVSRVLASAKNGNMMIQRHKTQNKSTHIIKTVTVEGLTCIKLFANKRQDTEVRARN